MTSSRDRLLSAFLSSNPTATYNLVHDLKFDTIRMRQNPDSGIFWYTTLRQKWDSARNIVQRVPIVWEVYVTPAADAYFTELLQRYRKHAA